MPFTTQVVPMPRWSTPVGCTKLALSLIILSLVAACCAIWGPYPAFGVSIFSASLSLVAFGYYLTALSFKPTFYNKWIVLILESLLTLFWFISLVLLAGWLGASTAFPTWYRDSTMYAATPYADAVDIHHRCTSDDNPSIVSSPLQLLRRQRTTAPSTAIRLHEQDNQDAARVLAGIAAALAGINFALYGITLIIFLVNFTKPERNAPTTIDEEAQAVPPRRINTDASTNTASVQPGSPTPPAVTQPLRVDTLPKDFEPKPQTQEHYLTPEQAAVAGIEPPTPVLKAQMAEKEKQKEASPEEKGKEKKKEESVPQITSDISPLSPMNLEQENEK